MSEKRRKRGRERDGPDVSSGNIWGYVKVLRMEKGDITSTREKDLLQQRLSPRPLLRILRCHVRLDFLEGEGEGEREGGREKVDGEGEW